MKRALLVLLMLVAAPLETSSVGTRRVELWCHRTANKDVPENTLESLEQAGLLGCDVVEIDVRRTLDGRIVLNHDGALERLTDGIGDVENTYYDDLSMRDAGLWMGDRFRGMRIALLEDALRLARKQGIRLMLDIKTNGIGTDVLELVKREGMLDQVQFGGESDDVKQMLADAVDDRTVWVEPGVTAEDVRTYHAQRKTVIANFSANGHEMDLAGMTAALTAGVNGINVDYPRLGADAVGRPVEAKLSDLVDRASTGQSTTRSQAILELSRYRGFQLQQHFERWLLDSDDHVSRAAAVALMKSRPLPSVGDFGEALRSKNADARANAAWALGILGAPVTAVVLLLKDQEPQVLSDALIAVSHMSGDVSANILLPLLAHRDPEVRGAAALALARHQPRLAISAVPRQLHREMRRAGALYDDYVMRGRPQLTERETAEIMGYFRCQMKMLQAISLLKGQRATELLEQQAFRKEQDFSQMNEIVAGFQLWDRIGRNVLPAIRALASTDSQVADRAEWMLAQAGPAVLPDVRKALASENAIVRERAVRILAWQGDLGSVLLIQESNQLDVAAKVWATTKIKSLHSNP